MAVIIEARLNEVARRDRNRHVPYTADEIVADAVACVEAGAAIVHFHAREDDGTPVQRAERYADIIRRIRARCDVLVHPTLGYAEADPDPERRFALIRALAADPATRPDLAPIDVGTTNVDAFDAASGRLLTRGRVYRNSSADIEVFAAGARATRLKPYLFCWTVGFSRQADQIIRLGLVEEPVFVGLVMTEGRIVAAHPASAAGLEAHLAFLPGGHGTVWSACAIGASLEPLVAPIVARGGHLAAGLGDHPYRELGEPGNAEVIAALAGRVRALGHSVADAAAARRILSLDVAPRRTGP